MGIVVLPAPTISIPAVKSERTVKINGTQSWTAPADVTSVEVILCGGGGSGAITTVNSGNNAAGGSGSLNYSAFSVTPSTA